MFKDIFLDDSYEDEALDGFNAVSEKLIRKARQQVARKQEQQEVAAPPLPRLDAEPATTPPKESSVLGRRLGRLEGREEVDRASLKEVECRRRLEILDTVKQVPSYDRPAFLEWVAVQLDEADHLDTQSVQSGTSTASLGSTASSSISSFSATNNFASMSMGSFGSFSSTTRSAVFEGGGGTGLSISDFGSGADLHAMASAMASLDARLTDAQLDKLLAKMKAKHERDRKKRNNYQKVHYRAGGHRRRRLTELSDTMMDEEEGRADLMHLEPLWLTKLESQWCGHASYPLIQMTIEEHKVRGTLLRLFEIDHRQLQAELLEGMEEQYRSVIHGVLQGTSPVETIQGGGTTPGGRSPERRRWIKKAEQGGQTGGQSSLTPVQDLDDWTILKNHIAGKELSSRTKISLVASYEYAAIVQDHILSSDLIVASTGHQGGVQEGSPKAPSPPHSMRHPGAQATAAAGDVILSPSRPTSAASSASARRHVQQTISPQGLNSLSCGTAVDDITLAKARLIDRKVVSKEESLVRSGLLGDEAAGRRVLDRHCEHVIRRTYSYVPLHKDHPDDSGDDGDDGGGGGLKKM